MADSLCQELTKQPAKHRTIRVAVKSGLLASQLPCPVDYSGVLSYLNIGVPTQLLSVLIPAHIKNKNKTARMRRGRSIIAGKEDEANVSIVSNANVN